MEVEGREGNAGFVEVGVEVVEFGQLGEVGGGGWELVEGL